MTATLTLTGADIDAIATGLFMAFVGVVGVNDGALVEALEVAALTQPSSPQAQTLLRLLAESVRVEMAQPEVTR